MTTGEEMNGKGFPREHNGASAVRNFDDFPDDLLISILARLSSRAECPADFFNVLLTCKRSSIAWFYQQFQPVYWPRKSTPGQVASSIFGNDAPRQGIPTPPKYSLCTFTGHLGTVMSLDFHPSNEDLVCSCDGESEIRYWSVSQGVCTRKFQGGTSPLRFQPRLGLFLAAAISTIK